MIIEEQKLNKQLTPHLRKTGVSGSTVLNRDGLPNSDNWETPEWLYNKLNAEFNFDYDPCPLNANFDGLKTEWGKSNFVNPPYNRVDKPKFIQKAFEEWQKGKTVVLLIPSATGTKQFHELILPNAEVRFLKGRVAFKGINTKGVYSTKNKGKHDSMICIFRGVS
jgi:site-specific DNA-methyltransferase (adenine-specific)